MDIKQKILRYLIENKEKTHSINEISKALKIDYKLVHTNVSKLSRNKSIKLEDFGNTKRCSFDNAFNNDIYIVENQRKDDLLKNKNFLVMYQQLSRINKQFIILMFGSQIKGTTHKHSDIDLLLIAEEDTIKKVENEINLLPLKIHLTAISYDNFKQMFNSKEFTVVSEAIKKNVILFGIEDYYRIIEHAR